MCRLAVHGCKNSQTRQRGRLLIKLCACRMLHSSTSLWAELSDHLDGRVQEVLHTEATLCAAQISVWKSEAAVSAEDISWYEDCLQKVWAFFQCDLPTCSHLPMKPALALIAHGSALTNIGK